MSQQKEKHSFLSKITKPFRSHSRSSSSNKSEEIESPSSTSDKNVIDAAYSEGQRRAKMESGTGEAAHGFDTKDKDIIQSAYLAGTKKFTDEKVPPSLEGQVLTSTSVGRIVTAPPEVKREPLPKDPPGDFTNEKKPIDLVKEEDKDKSDAAVGINHNKGIKDMMNKKGGALEENKNPNYADDANIQEGVGYFFDPKDTQGGVYTESDNYDEATRAKLDKKPHLKTVPTAYEQEQRARHVREIIDSAFEKGKSKGKKDATDAEHGKQKQSQKKQFSNKSESQTQDPYQEHTQNKSVYNKEGLSSATAEVDKYGHSMSSNTKSKDDANNSAEAGTDLSNSRSKGNQMSKANDDADHHSHTSVAVPQGSNSDATNSASSSGNKSDTPSSKPYLEKSISRSSKNFNYDDEIRKLDEQIGLTQSELDRLQKKGAFSDSTKDNTAEAYNQPKATVIEEKPESVQKNENGATISKFATSAASAAAAAASFVGFGSSKDHSKHSEVGDAYKDGVNAGTYERGSDLGNLQPRPETLSSRESKSNNTDGERKESCAADNGFASNGIGATSASDEVATDSTRPSGIVGGAIGTATKLVSNTLGFDSDDKDINKAELTPSTYVDTASKNLDIKDHPDEESKGHSLLDSAKNILGATGALAAGTIGYKGLSSTDDQSKIVNESFEAGRQRANKEFELKEGKSSKEQNKIEASNFEDTYDRNAKIAGSSHDTNASKKSNSSKSTGTGYASGTSTVPPVHHRHTSNPNADNWKEESLIENAERNFEDVAKAPAHKPVDDPIAGMKKFSDEVQQVPGLVSTSKSNRNSSEEEELTTSKFRELETESTDYNIKHGFKDDKRKLIDIAEDYSPDIKKLDPHHGDPIDEERHSDSGPSGDVQQVPTSVYEHQNEFLRTGGKRGQLSGPNGSTFSQDLSISKVRSAEEHPKHSHRESGLRITKSATDLNNSTSSSIYSDSINLRSSRNASSQSLGNETSSKRGFDHDTAAANESKSAVTGDRSHNASNSKSRENESLRNPTNTRSAIMTSKNEPETKESLSGEEAFEYYSAGVYKGSFESGQVKAAKDVSLKQKSGSKHRSADDSEHNGSNISKGIGIDTAGSEVTGESNELDIEPIKDTDEITVEVIGMKDKTSASKLARRTSQELCARGVDLTTGKLVINAETGEVYKTENTEDTLSSQTSFNEDSFDKSMSSSQKPESGPTHDALAPAQDASNPENYHEEHEKVKKRLAEAADAGVLGNTKASPPYTQSSTESNISDVETKDYQAEPSVASIQSSSTRSATKNEHKITQENTIVVTVQHLKDHEEAARIAKEAVHELKHHPNILSNVHQLIIDARTGTVTDEKGEIIDIRNPSLKSSKASSSRDLQPPYKSPRPAASQPKSKKLSPDYSPFNTSGIVGVGAGLGISGVYGANLSHNTHHYGDSDTYNTYAYSSDSKLVQSSDYDLKNSTPRTLVDNLVVDVVGATKEDQNRISKETFSYVRSHPDLIPEDIKKIIVDARTGIAIDENGKEIQALSSNRSTYSVDKENMPMQIPGSFMY